MSHFTCINCSVRFADADIQRDHYKTDWHRYNLKRKIALLPPVTAEEFQKRVIQQRAADEIAQQDTSLYCVKCRKEFSSQNSYDNHLKSKKHLENAEKFKDTAGSVDEDRPKINPKKFQQEEDEDDVEEVVIITF